jgi:hypothetical protein
MLAGRTGTAIVSPFVAFLSMLFRCEIVQIGNGRLNYINGYVSKDHDAVDVRLGKYVQKNASKPWLAAYRSMSKSAPCIPEVVIRKAQMSDMERSYAHVLLYPPQPRDMLELQGRQVNFSGRMYGAYLVEQRLATERGIPMAESFLQWHRQRQWDAEAQTVSFRGGVRGQHGGQLLVVACR